MQPNFSSNRLNYTLFIAITVHAFAILGIGFSWATSPKKAAEIEVTIAQFEAKKSNDESDYLAQINQQGSGTAKVKKKLSDEVSLSPQLTQTKITASQPNTSESQASEHKTFNDKLEQLLEKNISTFDVVNSINSGYKLNVSSQQSNSSNDSETAQKTSLSTRIVALQSQINLRRQKMAKAPKRRIISAVSTKSHQDAVYLENWRRRIVTVGNIHYPKAANEQKIYGRVRLLIAMRANGNIASIEILESSGEKILDHGAVKIIRLAAPFAPFSSQMRKNTDILEIIRTIEFEKTTQIY
ncbi:MAG: energy transducer TonB [Oceanospirillaceae bacterium]